MPELKTDDVMSICIGRHTIGENLARAIKAGQLIAHDDGTWELATKAPSGINPWLFGSTPAPYPCAPLMNFLFNAAYGKRIVPAGCRSCYKVKIVATTLRQLMAIHELAGNTRYPFKTGLELENRYSSGIYAGFFYMNSLEQARTVFRELRQTVDEHPLLGADVSMLIKRGCTEYEVHCGPSNTFPVASEETEAWLLARLKFSPRPNRPAPRSLTLAHWIQTAFKIGDETYLDFTHGRRLFPKAISYDP